MTVLSLFDGISCGQLALQRAGIPVERYFASEVDKYAIAITKKNFPKTVEIGDVRKVSGGVVRDEVVILGEEESYSAKHEDCILIGGSPCQSFTFAGKRQGMATSNKMDITTLEQYLECKRQGYEFEGQSYLFWEYVRVLNEFKPKYFLLENVKMDKKWQSVITKALGVEPVLINSNLVSAQNRQRLYWTNIPIKELPENQGIYLKDIILPDNGKYPLTKKHLEGFLRSYPNWKPCDIEGKSKPLLATYYKQPPHCPYIPSELSESGYRRLTPVECERLQTLPDNYTEGVSDMQRYKTIGNGWTVDVLTHIFKGING